MVQVCNAEHCEWLLQIIPFPSSAACGAKLLAVFFPLKGEGYCTDSFRFCFEVVTSGCLKSKMVISNF